MLAMTLIIIALITLVTFMAVNVSTLESRTAMQDYAGSRAMYAARAGLNYAMSKVTQLRDTAWVQNGGNVTLPLEPGVTSFTVVVRPHPDNTTTRTSQLAWEVVSTGFYGQPPRQAQRQVVAFIQQEPFSKYAYFTDRDIGVGGAIIRFVSNDAITGPVRTNGYFTIAGNPRFSDQMRSSNLSDTAYTAGPPPVYRNPNGTTTSDPARFYRTENNGSYAQNAPVALNNSPNFSFAGGQAEIPLPTDNDKIRTLAESNAPDTTNLAINTPGGALPPNHYKNPANSASDYDMVFDETTGRPSGFTRNGNNISASDAPPVFKMTFRSTPNPAGAVIQRWDSASTSFRNWDPVARNFTASTTVLDTSADTFHVDGFVVMEGTVKGRATVGSKYDVHLSNNLVYSDMAQDVLGIVAKEDIIVESRTNTSQDRTIHATMMALNGSFTVDKYNQGSPRGTLHLFGGIIQRTRGPVGTGSASQVSTGYAKDYRYDDKLITKPPLNFPNTGEVYIVNINDRGATGSL
ncbi:MAG: hypothetical protein AMXMBFR33_53910 [Candidatus Xenobia bacterium]